MATAEKSRKLKGFEFVIDEAGEKKAVLIDLRKHRALWEDFYDTAIAQSRVDEPRESLEQVRRRVFGND
jgi:hypothetical protein